jgi:hypothetical protein
MLADPGLGAGRVGDNEPYDGALEGDTLHAMATARGLPHILIEVRQDLIATTANARAWGARLADHLRPILADHALHAIRHYPSRATRRFGANRKGNSMPTQSAPNSVELEAAVLRRLIDHLRQRTDVQNIDLMNLAGFCRNCLSNWLEEEAKARGHAITRDEARERIYGMPYDEWKSRFQSEVSPESAAAFVKPYTEA